MSPRPVGVADLTAGFALSIDNGQAGERNSIRINRPNGRVVVTVTAIEPFDAAGKPASAGALMAVTADVRAHLDAALASARRAVGVAVNATQAAAA